MKWLAMVLFAAVLGGCGGESAPSHEAGGEPAKTEAEKPAAEPAKAEEPKAEPPPAEVSDPGLPADANPALTDPKKATEKAPDQYKVKFETTKGDFVVEVHKDW